MKKICPFHKSDILKITHWLNEQSSYGWALDSWGMFFCEFKESDGERYQYQLDMDNWEDGPNEERRVQLESLGWKYVETIGGTRIHIYRSLDWKASIPRNEEFIQYNRKKLRFVPIIGLLGILLSLALFLWVPFSKMQFMLVELAECDKSAIPLLVVIIVIAVLQFFNNEWPYYQLYKYLGKVSSITILETEREIGGDGLYLPLGWIQWGLMIGALFFVIWMTYGNPKVYTEPLLAERHYEYIEQFSEALDGEYNLNGKYWMNISENVEQELFVQIVERYAGYSNYYGYNSFRKEEYDTHDLWKLTEQEDERFDKLVVAKGRDEFLGDGLIFAQMEDDIIYLRYWGERDISQILDKITEIEYR